MRKFQVPLAVASLTAIGALALAGAAPGQPAPPPTPPPAPSASPPPAAADASAVDPGQTLMETKCVACHDTGVITQMRRPKGDWRDLINQMIGRGAEVSDAEADQIQAYLEKNYALPPAP